MRRLILHDIMTWTASVRRLERDQLSLTPSPEPDGLDALYHTTEGQSGGMAEMGATFHWTASHMLMRLNALNPERLTGLDVKPEYLRAYRDGYALFSSGAYVQASEAFGALPLKSEHRALRWRVHFFKGLLRLGFVGHEPELIDCDRGRANFDSAADLTATHAPRVAAQALVLLVRLTR